MPQDGSRRRPCGPRPRSGAEGSRSSPFGRNRDDTVENCFAAPHNLAMSAAAPPMRLSKRLYIKTYGCQMNVYDSERMADVLSPLGYAITDQPQGADLVVLNTCHIREKATEKVYSELGKLKEMREESLADGGPRSTIVVAGCVAQAEGEEIMRRQPAVDLVVGPQAYHQLPELIARTHRARGERLSADFAPEAKFDALAPTQRTP